MVRKSFFKYILDWIIISDWDLDGFKDVLLPFQSGHVIAMTLSPATVAIDVLPIDAGPLSDMSEVDINLDKIKDENIFDHDKELNNLEILFTKIEDDNWFTLPLKLWTYVISS